MYDMYHWDDGEARQPARRRGAAFAGARGTGSLAEPQQPLHARYRPADQALLAPGPAGEGAGDGDCGHHRGAAWAVQVALDRRDNGGDAVAGPRA